MKDQVLEFINRRFKADCDWCAGNCYWFSHILASRFPNFDIYLFPIENHFMVGNGCVFYDFNGKRTIDDCSEIPVLWNSYSKIDSTHYFRLVRDCVM